MGRTGFFSVTRCLQTIRRRDLTLPGRITGSARRCTLHLRPWHEGFTLALSRLRALPLPA